MSHPTISVAMSKNEADLRDLCNSKLDYCHSPILAKELA